MYTPSPEILKKYADLLVNYALGGGKGIAVGETVQVHVPECAKPFYAPLRDAIIDAGGHAIMQFTPDNVGVASVYERMSPEQLSYFPEKYYKGIVEQCDHSIAILAEFDKHELESVSPAKLLQRSKALKPYREWREAKESQGAFTWTLALYGTEAMAREVGMTLEEYWEQIISACYLNAADPIAEWRRINQELEATKQKLNALSVKEFHIEADTIDLWIARGPNRHWLGGGGRNIPSFELFISPDWRGTRGHISFDQPLYYLGSVIEGVSLTFKDGVVVESAATKNHALLKEMIATENADKIGEFSLTDGRLSNITRFMGETLYDENRGGEQGNTHIALGNAYQDSYTGDPAQCTKSDWEQMGFNQSVIHTDIVSTARRTVTAHLEDGTALVIYADGKFVL